MAVAENWLPLNGELTFGVTACASCPNNIVEEIILRAYELRGASADEVLGYWPALERVDERDVIEEAPPKFREAGLRSVTEVVWRSA